MRVSVLLPTALLTAFLCMVAGFAGPNTTATANTEAAKSIAGVEPQSTEVRELERRVFRQINAIRREQGRSPLSWNPELADVARAYSRSRSEQGFSGHIDPQGRGPADRLEAAGLGYRMVGENLARNYNMENPVEAAVTGWLGSERHRENVLRSGYTETGIGVWRDDSTYHFTQLFFTAAGG